MMMMMSISTRISMIKIYAKENHDDDENDDDKSIIVIEAHHTYTKIYFC
jgi:hypothetical protein